MVWIDLDHVNRVDAAACRPLSNLLLEPRNRRRVGEIAETDALHASTDKVTTRNAHGRKDGRL
jgi:hypothetical protein